MNDKIKELVGQAKFMAEDTINKQISKNVELDAFAEKLAELLVKECCSIMMDLRTRPADLAVKDIKLHFGIKDNEQRRTAISTM